MPSLYVISLGGSLINPGEIDTKFLADFKKLIESQTGKGSRFILVTGGGAPARQYQQGLKSVSRPSPGNLDWMGIETTRVNARLVQLMLGALAHKQIVTDPTRKLPFSSKVLIGSGWKPGRSTDFVSVMLAKAYGSTTVINLSNIDYVYTKDPRKFSDAKKIEQASWKELLKITGSKWNPGANVPFDPTAAQFAMKNKLRVIIANGKNLKNLKYILEGKKFQGTIID